MVTGTEFKLNINMEPMDGYSLSDIDWSADVYSKKTGKKVTIDKADARKVDNDNYIIVVDSSAIGAGAYWLMLTAYIPDADCKDGIRTVKASVSTGVTIDGIW